MIDIVLYVLVAEPQVEEVIDAFGGELGRFHHDARLRSRNRASVSRTMRRILRAVGLGHSHWKTRLTPDQLAIESAV